MDAQDLKNYGYLFKKPSKAMKKIANLESIPCTKAYKFQRVSPRKLNLELYAVYSDRGPYCLSWIPVKAKDIPQLKTQLVDKGYKPLEGE